MSRKLTALSVLLLVLLLSSAQQPDKKPRRVPPPNISPSWIWAAEQAKPGQTVYFRKEFMLNGSISAARLAAACDDEMTLYIAKRC